MSQKNNQQPAEPQSNAENEGVSDELSIQAIKDLAGYLDVLIQMDLENKQRKERKSNEEKQDK